jgi:O-antigen ligase
MVLTFARGGWIGLVVAAAIFLVMIDRRFILLGIIALVAMYFLLPDVIMARLMSVGNLKDGSTSYRMYIWLGTLAMLRDFWFVGIGPGEAAFNRIYPRYGYNAIAAPHSHNLFLQFACDAGVLAPILFICMMFSYVRSLATSIVRDKATEAGKALRYYRIAAIASLAGFIVQSMTDYSFYNYRVALIFWGVTGLGLALASVNSEQITDNSWGRGTTGDEDGGEYEA